MLDGRPDVRVLPVLAFNGAVLGTAMDFVLPMLCVRRHGAAHAFPSFVIATGLLLGASALLRAFGP